METAGNKEGRKILREAIRAARGGGAEAKGRKGEVAGWWAC